MKIINRILLLLLVLVLSLIIPYPIPTAVDSALINTAAASVIYPNNLTATYKGNWQSLSPTIPLTTINFDSISGVIAYKLTSYPTINTENNGNSNTNTVSIMHYCHGELLIRNGQYLNNADLRFYIRGFYLPQLGQFYSINNINNWNTIEYIQPLIIENNPNYINNTIITRILQELPELLIQLNTTYHHYLSNELLLIESIEYNSNIEFSACQLIMKFQLNTSTVDIESEVIKLEHQVIELEDSPDTADNREKLRSVLQSIKSLQSNRAMIGTVNSPFHSCNFNLSASTSVLAAQRVYHKAINYAMISTAIAGLLIYFCRNQMLVTNTQTAATKISMLTIGLQGLLDSYSCVYHLGYALDSELLFNWFLILGITFLLLFSMFELRFLLELFKSNHSDAFNNGWESVRRQLASLYGKFYAALFCGILIIYRFPLLIPYIMFICYSYWIPQIIHNARNNTSKSLQFNYIISMSLLRLFIPLYAYLCPVNWINSEPNLSIALTLIIYVAAQMIILLLQDRYGPRFFIHKSFYPKQYNYHRPIPRRTAAAATTTVSTAASVSVNNDSNNNHSIIRVNIDREDSANSRTGLMNESEETSLINNNNDQTNSNSLASEEYEEIAGINNQSNAIEMPSLSLQSGNNTTATTTSSSTTATSTVTDEDNTCCICLCEIPIDIPLSDIMVAPCNHYFHTECLTQWMEQKLACPNCRAKLPSIRIEEEEINQ